MPMKANPLAPWPTTGKAASFVEQSARGSATRPTEFLKLYPAGSDEEAMASHYASFRDFSFGWQMRTWVRMQAKTGKSKAFLYYFDRVPPGPDSGRYGAFHASEIAYVFENSSAAAAVGRCRPEAFRGGVLLLGEFRRHWRSERKKAWRSGRRIRNRAMLPSSWAIKSVRCRSCIKGLWTFSTRISRRSADSTGQVRDLSYLLNCTVDRSPIRSFRPDLYLAGVQFVVLAGCDHGILLSA